MTINHSISIGSKIILVTSLALTATTAIAKGGLRASADIVSCNTDVKVTGTATLRETPSTEGVKVVEISMNVNGLPAGKHAVHIHENATCTPCGAAAGHFDPGPHSNSNPDGNHPFHSGDLINIDIKSNGKGKMSTTTSRITLSPGPLSLFDANGSAFIIHVNEDSYCPEGVVKGCAGGARAACGIIVCAN